DLALDAVRGRLDELTRRRAGLHERLARAERIAAERRAQESQQEATRRFCTLTLKGLTKLDGQGRQQLLQALIDEIIVRPNELEIRGVLPGRWVPPSSARNRLDFAHGRTPRDGQDDAGTAARGDFAAALTR